MVGLLFLSSCKVSRIATQSDTQPDTLLLSPKNPILSDTLVYHLTQDGDTLLLLDEEVDLRVHRIRRDTISIATVGDIMMGTNFPNTGYLPPNKGEELWQEVKATLSGADVTFGNLEGVILTEGGDPKECKNPKNCYLFRTPDNLAYNFQDVGFDLLSTANNHANDFGEEGRLNTQRVLDSLGIIHAGSIETPYSILRRKDIVIGFVAFSPNKGTQIIHDMEQAISLVKMLDSLTDLVIVSFHAGAEGPTNQHITREREYYFGEDRGNVYEFAHQMIDHGADVLLGHGPHVVRGIELYKNRIIAYSLGNFLTYGRFNLKGPNAYAPILEIKTGPDGAFYGGVIHSFIQDYGVGPLRDEQKRAAKTIKELSKTDFPESWLQVDSEGQLIKKNPDGN